MGNRNVSRVQFGALAQELNTPGEYGSGFSVKYGGSKDGQIARNKYLVGGLTGAPEGVLKRPTTGGDIQAYAETHTTELGGRDQYLGGWGPTEMRESAILDVSTAFPNTDHGRLSAAMNGMANGEDEIGAVDWHGEYDSDRAIDVSTGMAHPMPGVPRAPANARRQSERG